MKKQILALLILFVFAQSCKTAKKAETDNGTNTGFITSGKFRKPLKDKELFTSTLNAVLLDTVYISADTLHIFTKKITGCNADNFKLIWNGDLGKAIPPKTSVKLFQLVDGACRERHKFHLFYNISTLKLKSDTSANKLTLIQVGGWPRTNSYSHN